MDGPSFIYRIGLRWPAKDLSKMRRHRNLVIDPDDARLLDQAIESATTGEPLIVQAADTVEVYKMAADFTRRFGLTEPTVEDMNVGGRPAVEVL